MALGKRAWRWRKRAWRGAIVKVARGNTNPCSENKGADQLRGYHEADLRLCFHICKKPVFS